MLHTTVPFTSFAAVQANQTATMGGMVQTASGNVTVLGPTTQVITSGTAAPAETTATTGSLTFDGAAALSGMSVTSGPTSIAFSRSAGDAFTCSSGVCGASNATSEAIVYDARVFGWNYQTFGVWDKATSSPPTTYQVGGFSLGAATPASAVPTSGPATFTGLASGFFVDPTGTPFFTAANMTAVTDFSARQINFSTLNTTLVNLNTSASSANGNLDLTGTLTYAAGTNLFSGPVTNAGTTLNGSATGRFYGPNAEEIGGVYSLTGASPSGMLGSFGGKR